MALAGRQAERFLVKQDRGAGERADDEIVGEGAGEPGPGVALARARCLDRIIADLDFESD